MQAFLLVPKLLLLPSLLLLPPGLTSQMATLGLTQRMATLGLTQQGPMGPQRGPSGHQIHKKIRRPFGRTYLRTNQGEGLPSPLTPLPWTPSQPDGKKHVKNCQKRLNRCFTRALRPHRLPSGPGSCDPVHFVRLLVSGKLIFWVQKLIIYSLQPAECS